MRPTQVHLRQADHLLEVAWDDGSETSYDLAYLRGWCPCAKCQGHFAEAYTFVERASDVLVRAEPVGGYAMRLVWADGHQSGLYAFTYLRELAKGPPSEGPDDALCRARRAGS